MIEQQKNKQSHTFERQALQGKVILLTGATGGIGQAVAKQLTQSGAEVILLGRHKKKLEALYDSLLDLGPEGALYVTDLLRLGVEELEELRSHIDDLFGRLDGFIHCAGHWGTLTPLEHYSEKQWLEIIHLNLNVPFLLVKHLLPLIKKAPTGSILFSQSSSAHEIKPFHGAFQCAEFGLTAMISLLQEELEHTNVHIAGVNPGAVDTALRKKLFPAEEKEIATPDQASKRYLEKLLDHMAQHTI